MTSNAFSKEERVAFDQVMEGFEDQEVMSKNVSVFNTDSTSMERSSNVIWRPQPYILQSYDGSDMTGNFSGKTQLSVPATLGYEKSAPWEMTSTELRDALQENRLGDAAKQKLASDINLAVLAVACNQGTLVVTRTTAASGFDDVAMCDSIMNEQGIPAYDRYLALTSRDYNGMASNLAGRATMTGKPTTAYEKAYVGNVAGFETFKLDNGRRITAAAATGITINTLNAGAQYYVPKATSVASAGEKSNVDNRYQRVTVNSTTSVVAGDAFTAADCYAVHHITKQSTGQLKTFRVISVDSDTTMTISPPIISAVGGSDAEEQYQNCYMAAKSATAALVWLNTDAVGINPFWQKDAIELLPGRFVVPADAGAAVMRATTASGIEVVMMKQFDINTRNTKYRLDTFFGVCNKQPEMSGILLFSQNA
jgi:hypothetical protein